MKPARWAILLAVLALSAAACGYSDTSGDNDVTTTSVPMSEGAARGQEHFSQSCTACHGQNAEGITGLGPDMHDNAFIQSVSDDELVAFLEEGRAVDDPDNTTGVAMPPKGGNSSLTDDDLADIAEYLRTLQ